MTILIVDNLKKSFGARVIFQSVTFSVGQGERMCVVGRNGEGKTTLLRVIAGELEQDGGSFQVVGRRPSATCPRTFPPSQAPYSKRCSPPGKTYRIWPRG
jgi:ATP-binding cassette subfamily F protein uup